MRVLQLIDSLRSGGAERMSVTYANALANRIDGSCLCCTRMEGLLKSQLSPEVGYLFLNKKSTVDLQAFGKLRRFVKENKIDIIQAHSSSWFLALLVKVSLPGLKLVWHDHYGRELRERKPGLIKPASKYFDGIIAVNKNLETWSKKYLYSMKVRYIRNFLPEISTLGEEVELKGGGNFNIICVANLRPQKDHLNLLQAYKQVLNRYPNTSLHLIGKDEKTSHSLDIKKYIDRNDMREKVFIYGEQENIASYLNQADLGVLASASEGLPLALLEYGFSGLPIVCTEVGECKAVVGDYGQIVHPQNPEALANAILFYIENEDKRRTDAIKFNRRIRRRFSSEIVVPKIIQFFENIGVAGKTVFQKKY